MSQANIELALEIADAFDPTKVNVTLAELRKICKPVCVRDINRPLNEGHNSVCRCLCAACQVERRARGLDHPPRKKA